MPNERIECDVLVLGCGIAGGIAALELADTGLHVVVATRSARAEETATHYAQGGIVYRAGDESPDQLIEDIVHAGAGLCNRRAVEILAHEGPPLVERVLLEKLRVPFDRMSDGSLSLVREGGHSLPRILHVTDATGSAIEKSILAKLQNHPKIALMSGVTAIDLLTPAHHSLNRISVYDPLSCVGAYLLDQSTGTVVRCLARKTVLATGGLGQIFLRTTNPAGARGDGLAMAYRAGARVVNCEFIQFHPTAFYSENAPCFLISEAVRGAGARLIDARGEPFMQKYDAKWKDLAPRDVVARSIHEEMLAQNLSNVYLDIASYLPAAQIEESFPSIHRNCLQYGVDMTREPVPVVPAAHYSCGGVWSDEFGQTTVSHLYAVGEVACTGVHGANRLASTSLLEGLVWGYRAAHHIAETLNSHPNGLANEIPPWHETGRETPDSALIAQDMSVIKHIMWNYTGLIRTARRLQRAIRELRHLESEIERFYRAVRLTDELIGLRNAVRAALIVAIAAWENKTSVGCHFRQ